MENSIKFLKYLWVILLWIPGKATATDTLTSLPSSLTTSEAISAKENASIHSQSVLKLSLKEAILLALRRNPDIRSGELQRVVEKFNLAIAYEKFSPQFSLSGQAVYQKNSGPQYTAFPTAKVLTPLGTSLETTLTPAYNSWGDGSGTTSNVHVGITQPLLRGFGTTINKLDLVDAAATEKSAQLNWKNKISDIVVSVVQYYYQVVQANNDLRINQLSLKEQENTLKQIEAKINEGKLAPSEAIQAKANIANQRLAVNRNQASIMEYKQNLLTVLGLDPTAKVEVDQKTLATATHLPTLEQSIQIGLDHNNTYQQAILDCQKSERELLRAKDNKKWQLDATAAIDQPIGNSGGDQVNKSLIFKLDVPIKDREREKRLLNAKVLLQKANIDKIQIKNKLVNTITNEYNNLQFSKEQIDLADSAVKFARQSLEIAKIKFKYGKATIFELTTLQAALAARELDQMAQNIRYLFNIEQFYQLLGITLARWDLVLATK